MELTKRSLLITPTFLAIQEKKNSEKLVSKNDNKPLWGVIVTTCGLKKSGLELSYHKLPGIASNDPSFKP